MTDRRQSELLRIDVDAEIRKLSGQRFRSAGEYAVELVRFAAGLMPVGVDVRVTRRELVVSVDGAGLPGILVKRLVVVFDRDRPDGDRHRALVSLEEESGRGILSAFALPGARVLLDGLVDGRPRGIEISSSRPLRRSVSNREEGIAIRIRSRHRRPGLERRLLCEACRHSTLPIYVDGELVSRGMALEDALVQVELRNPRMSGVIGFAMSGDLVRISRLRNGVRAEDVVRPTTNGMVFHAIVDEKDDDFESTWRTLRRAGRRLFERLGEQHGKLSEKGRARALELLFNRYRHTRELRLLEGVRAFPRVGGAPLDLLEVRQLARRGPLWAIDAAASVRDYQTEGREVLRLDPIQRDFLEGEIGATLMTPSSRGITLGSGDRLRASVRWAGRRISSLLGGGPGAPVRDGDLDETEAAFLDAIRAEIRSGAFALPDGDRPFRTRVLMAEGQRRPWVRVARRDGRAEYRVSRNHPEVEAMLAAFAKDPSYAYPALYALVDGRDGYVDSREGAQDVILARHGIGARGRSG